MPSSPPGARRHSRSQGRWASWAASSASGSASPSGSPPPTSSTSATSPLAASRILSLDLYEIWILKPCRQ
uniref:Uncharacterized protein n=1 Tax=Arundo donax TaxID=35708 RepID=A0A0A9GIH7_ARUDO